MKTAKILADAENGKWWLEIDRELLLLPFATREAAQEHAEREEGCEVDLGYFAWDSAHGCAALT